MSEAPAGKLIDWRHRVVRTISEDPLGEVFEVEAIRLQKKASLKLYKRPIAPAKDATERFLTEMAAYAADATLNGRVLDFGFHEGHPYVVFDPSGEVASPEDAIPKIKGLVESLSDPLGGPVSGPMPAAVSHAAPIAEMSMGLSLPDVTFDAELIEQIESDSGKGPPPIPKKAASNVPPPPPPSNPPKKLPNFDEISISPDPPFFDSGTIRVRGDERMEPRRPRAHVEPTFWQKHGGAVKGFLAALYLLAGTAALAWFVFGPPDAARDARRLVRKGLTPQVIVQLEKYVALPNPDPALRAALGYAFIYAKKPHRALAEYKAALDGDPRVLQPADVAAIRALIKMQGEDGVEAAALVQRIGTAR